MIICYNIVNISNCGGTERVVLSIGSKLAELGYDVHILTREGNRKPFFNYNNKIQIHRLFSNWEIAFFTTHPKYIIWKCRLFYKLIRPDIVIDTELLSPNLTIEAIRPLKIKHVVWDNFSYEVFKNIQQEHIALEKIKNYGSHLVTLTKKDRELFITYEGFDPTHIHQIYNALTIFKNHYVRREEKTVLSVGRFAHEKGFDLLLKAWEIVEQRVPDWNLEIYGDTGTNTGKVWETFKKLNIKRASLFPATKDIGERFDKAGIYVLPSRHEPFGLVLLEAAAYSLPLIAFDCPNGPREIINDGYNGLLVEQENVEALAKTLIRLIKDEGLRHEISKNSFEHSKKFDIDNIIMEWTSLFEEI
jgi:glycosyltransferase involved in cell wall biosynthesis